MIQMRTHVSKFIFKIDFFLLPEIKKRMCSDRNLNENIISKNKMANIARLSSINITKIKKKLYQANQDDNVITFFI